MGGQHDILLRDQQMGDGVLLRPAPALLLDHLTDDPTALGVCAERGLGAVLYAGLQLLQAA